MKILKVGEQIVNLENMTSACYGWVERSKYLYISFINGDDVKLKVDNDVFTTFLNSGETYLEIN